MLDYLLNCLISMFWATDESVPSRKVSLRYGSVALDGRGVVAA